MTNVERRSLELATRAEGTVTVWMNVPADSQRYDGGSTSASGDSAGPART